MNNIYLRKWKTTTEIHKQQQKFIPIQTGLLNMSESSTDNGVSNISEFNP